MNSSCRYSEKVKYVDSKIKGILFVTDARRKLHTSSPLTSKCVMSFAVNKII